LSWFEPRARGEIAEAAHGITLATVATAMHAIGLPRGTLVATLALLAGAGSGCGKAVQTNADGGDGSISADAPGSGPRSFDVTAVLHPDGGASGVPPFNTFTLVLDAAAGRAIAGGNGLGAVVAVDSSDGRTFHSTAPFSVGAANPGVCDGVEAVRYDGFEITVVGGALSGSATGAANISCGDCSFMVPFAAALSGAADTTPPRLVAGGATPATPFDLFGFATSEPLPATATAQLVGADGTAIDLLPSAVDGALPLVVGFSKPDVVLPAGQAYHVTLDGLVDFAGLHAQADPPLGVTSFPAAPTVPEDGFESATGSSLGGAMVMTGGPLPAIAGNTSLYIGSVGAPGLDGQRSLMVKLARQAGQTTLRFSYRSVSLQSPPSFSGFLQVGSEGGSADQADYSFATTDPTETLTVAGQTAYASAVATKSVSLPADATDQVLVVIAPFTTSCGPIRVQNQGLLIDDLRLE
jgi:hypothetical protein